MRLRLLVQYVHILVHLIYGNPAQAARYRPLSGWPGPASGFAPKTERTTSRTREDAKAEVFDHIERFYNPRRRHSTLGYLSLVQYEEHAMLA